jgi:hypothetical protein
MIYYPPSADAVLGSENRKRRILKVHAQRWAAKEDGAKQTAM